jgi:Fe-S oxidoreductase
LPAWRRRWRPAPRRDAGGGRPIVLFADTFNTWWEPENLDAAQRVLEATGHEVIVAADGAAQPLCCGRTYLAVGMVDEARREALRTIEALRPHLEAGTPVVGLEPSCVFTFRDEYAALFLDDRHIRLLAGAELIDQYLARECAAARIALPWRASPATALRVHGHCHQKAFDAFDATLALLRAIPGADVTPIESSCCGMAGAFGHERGHFDVSMAMAEATLLPAVRAAPSATIVAAGTSCRQQIFDGAGRRAVHPVAIVAGAL